jgi:Zinc finger, C3HC4 type (RING finger)
LLHTGREGLNEAALLVSFGYDWFIQATISCGWRTRAIILGFDYLKALMFFTGPHGLFSWGGLFNAAKFSTGAIFAGNLLFLSWRGASRFLAMCRMQPSGRRLRELLAAIRSDDCRCSICFDDTVENLTELHCGHILCSACAEGSICRGRNTGSMLFQHLYCPMRCGAPLGK